MSDAPPGTTGLVLIIAADVLLLFCAGVFNPTFITTTTAGAVDA